MPWKQGVVLVLLTSVAVGNNFSSHRLLSHWIFTIIKTPKVTCHIEGPPIPPINLQLCILLIMYFSFMLLEKEIELCLSFSMLIKELSPLIPRI